MIKKVILWDWDNTLVDTREAIFHAQNALRASLELPVWTAEQSREMMNKSGRIILHDIVAEKFPDDTPELAEQHFNEANKNFISFYQTLADKIMLKDGAEEILSWASQQGYINILASNKRQPVLINEVQAKGLTPYFMGIFGATVCENDKPSKEFTDFVLSQYPHDTLISIGDGDSDIQMAHNYAYGTAILVDDSAHVHKLTPDYRCENLAQVKDILTTLPCGFGIWEKLKVWIKRLFKK